MIKKMKTLVKDEGADTIYVTVPEEALPPDDKDGIESARAYWEAMGFMEYEGDVFASNV